MLNLYLIFYFEIVTENFVSIVQFILYLDWKKISIKFN